MTPTPDPVALRAALPVALLRPSTVRSFGYVLRDGAALVGVYALASAVDSPWLTPLFAFAEGTLFWALFVLGHDCGHGAFSRHRRLNTIVGHALHTPLLVPYHAWRISHRLHHRHAGDVERDATWFPLTPVQLAALPGAVRWLRLRGFLLVFPLYLLRGTPGRAHGSHFDPRCSLFAEHERRAVATSVALCACWLLGLASLTAWQGPAFVARHWLAPWFVFCLWAALVTYLHHTDPDVPWYRGAAWSPLRGALATVNRRYGPFERIHHDAGCHVAHHLFPELPHYALRPATEALRPLLGEALRESHAPVLRALFTAARECEAVAETGEVVRYARLAAPAPSGAASSPATT
ncbi:MAG TPA: fatty acid desaturase [Myxococcota bacterium]|jgi:omega-3 fatty acid desaturase (delta-15 desaturase)|nr:fatty acid desaturase [Myxococcota bacterium]